MENDVCFLCRAEGKAKLLRFYSGEKKGGTTHRMVTCTITFMERWNDLVIHEIRVCRACREEHWRAKHSLPMKLYSIGSAVCLILAVVLALVLWGQDYFVLSGFFLTVGCVLGGYFAYHWQKSRLQKPPASELEPLLIESAMDKMIEYNHHSFMTTEQYLERYRAGVLG